MICFVVNIHQKQLTIKQKVAYCVSSEDELPFYTLSDIMYRLYNERMF